MGTNFPHLLLFLSSCVPKASSSPALRIGLLCKYAIGIYSWKVHRRGGNTLALLFGNRAEVRHLIFVHFQGIGVMTTVNMTNRHCLSEFTANGTMLDRR